MAKIKVAINGFGRIGRLTFKSLLGRDNVEIVAINDLTDNKTLAHLLKYDSVHGRFHGEVSYDEESLTVNGQRIAALAERDPKLLPWGKMGVDVVLESTGRFVDEAGAGQHLTAGCKKVVISAPATGNIPTVVLGVNEDILTGAETILSNASCTTNCLAPMAKALDDAFGIERLYHHGARLHLGPKPAGRPPQGPAPRPRRRLQHHPDQHRRRQGRGPGAAPPQGQARRAGHARAHPGRLDDGPDGYPEKGGYQGRN